MTRWGMSMSRRSSHAFLIHVLACATVILCTLIALFQSTAMTMVMQYDSSNSRAADLWWFSRLSYSNHNKNNTDTADTDRDRPNHHTSTPTTRISSTSTPSSPYAITTTTTTPPIVAREMEENGEEEKEEGFSACLIWMDDNPRLVEWIAYHYYMLNLTYLVVGVAPGATTSPHSILHRWRDRITIRVWKLQALNEKENTTNNESNASKIESNNNRMEEFDYTLMDLKEDNQGDSHWQHWQHYVDRQTRFYQACAFFLKDQNRSWTAFHDVDEYIVLRSSGSTTKDVSNTNTSIIVTTNTTTHRNHHTMILPPPPPPGIVLQYLQQYNHDHETLSEEEFNATWNFWSIHSPCLQIPRALFGAVPSTDAEVMRGVPSELIHQLHNTTTTTSHSSSTSTSITDHPNPNQSVSTAVDFIRQLETLNYRYQITASRPDQLDMDGIPKVVMDVSKLDPIILRRSKNKPNSLAKGDSVHRPFKRFCPYPHFWLIKLSQRNTTTTPLIPLRIHHYVGSWERYSYRQNDARRSGHRNYAMWAAKARGQDGGVQDAYVRPWLAGLVAQVGSPATAHALLEGAGLPPNYRVSESYTKRWAYNESSGVQWNEKGMPVRDNSSKMQKQA